MNAAKHTPAEVFAADDAIVVRLHAAHTEYRLDAITAMRIAGQLESSALEGGAGDLFADFGDGTEYVIDVPTARRLAIDLNAAASRQVGRQLDGGRY